MNKKVFVKGSKEAKAYMAKLRRMRKSNISEKKKIKTKRRNKSMPKRRRTRTVYRKAKRYYRKKSGMKGAVGQAIGAGIYAMVGENLINGMVNNIGLGIPVDVIKLGGGYYLSRKSGILGGVGKAMFIISVYDLAKQFTGGSLNLGNLFGGNTAGRTPVTTSNIIE